MPVTLVPSPDFPPPHPFIEDFCSHHGLVPASRVGSSRIERACARHAERARDQYKAMRDSACPPTHATDVARLSPREKYARRLRNNRKSAAATRVYHEVLRRELATVLCVAERAGAGVDDVTAFVFEIERLKKEIGEADEVIERLREEVSREKALKDLMLMMNSGEELKMLA